MRRANRKDANHRQVINEFRRLGWQVLDTADLKNAFDILVSKRMVTVCIEIKDGEKPPSARRLTAGEQNFKDNWRGNYKIIKSLQEVQDLNNRFHPI